MFPEKTLLGIKLENIIKRLKCKLERATISVFHWKHLYLMWKGVGRGRRGTKVRRHVGGGARPSSMEGRWEMGDDVNSGDRPEDGRATAQRLFEQPSFRFAL